MRFADPKMYLVPKPEPTEMNAVNENVAAALGRPITAFPSQEHLAHLQVHLDFLASPLLGSNVIMATKYIPPMLTHLSEHMTLWYATEIHRVAVEATGQDLQEFQQSKDPEVKQKFDILLAAASQKVAPSVTESFSKIPPIIAQAMQIMSKLAPPNAGDPSQASAAASMAETQRKTQADQANQQFKVIQLQKNEEKDASKTQLKAQTDAARIASAEKLAADESATRREVAATAAATTLQVSNLESDTKLQTNADDNRTALEIAHAEIAAGNKTNVSTGGGLGSKGS